MAFSKVVGAIEIGTSKIAILVGEISSNNSLNIIGHYSVQSKGVKKSAIEDLQLVGEIVHHAIDKAESSAGTKVEEVYLAQSGQHLSGVFNIGTANVIDSNGIVGSADIDRAKEDARRPQLPEGRSYINHIQNPYSLDGIKVDNPLKLEGKRLKVGYWNIHGENKVLQDNLRLINGIPLSVEEMIVSSIASGNILLQDNEKKNGALVIDIGGGTTDFVLYQGGYIVYTGVIPAGGDHISNDLSIGLRTNVPTADGLKIREGLALKAKKNIKETVWLIGNQSIGDREIPLISINKIVEARLKEIFELIMEELEEAKLWKIDLIESGVTITGGTSRINGIDKIASKVFGMDTKLGVHTWDISSDLNMPEYSTTLGLLSYALAGFEEKQNKNSNNTLGNIWRTLFPNLKSNSRSFF